LYPLDDPKDGEEKKMEFGKFGGQFVPDHILKAVKEVEEAYNTYKQDPEFLHEFKTLLHEYAGRPSLLYYAKNMTEDLGGAKIYFKREDLNHTGAHKINNVLGQALLAKKMGKKKLIAETGAGQHGVATATAAALFGMECEIHMGAVDCEKQALNVYRMELLGAKVVPVQFGLRTLKEAVDSALMTWSQELDTTFYLIGSAVGPHPYPVMVKDFQSVISREIKAQMLEKEGRLPDMVIACVGGGSNAIGAFADFLDDKDVKLVGVEAAGRGLNTKDHAATMMLGQTGVIHGMNTKVLLEPDGEISPVYSISAGLDYPGVGPEHAYLEEIGRVEYTSATDLEAIEAFEYLSKKEGIIPAIESSHAIAEVMKRAKTLPKETIIVVNLSGRGDKDVKQIAKYQGKTLID
jgi:tryptophan synthase beta chain